MLIGKRVQFHHYPEFKPLHGAFGDTLIWDAFENRLFIQSEYEEYAAICYRFYQNGTTKYFIILNVLVNTSYLAYYILF